MADTDKIVKVLIELGLTNEQAGERAKQIIKELESSTSDVSRATQELGDTEKQTSKATEEHGLSQHELKKVLMEIGNTAAPGAGRALAELAMGPVGAALALVSVFELFKRKLEDVETELGQVADAASRPMTAGSDGLRDAWKNAKIALAEYYSSLDNAGKEKDPIATQIQRIKQIEDAQIESIKKIIEEFGKQEIARLKAEGASPEKISEAEQRTRDSIAAKEIEHAKAGDINGKHPGSGSGLLHLEQEERLKQDQHLIDEANAALAKQKKAHEKLTNLEAEKINLESSLGMGEAGRDNVTNKAEQKKLDELQKERAARQAQYDGAVSWGNESVAGIAKRELDKIDKEVGEVNEAREARKRRLDQVNEDYFGTQRASKNADRAAADATAASENNKGRLRNLPGEISHTQQVEGIQKHTDDVTAILNKHGGQLHMTFGQLAAATGRTQEQTINLINEIISHEHTVAERMAQMEAQLRSTRRQVASAAYHTSN